MRGDYPLLDINPVFPGFRDIIIININVIIIIIIIINCFIVDNKQNFYDENSYN